MSRVRGLLDSLLGHERSRRALEETWLDIETEGATATRPPERLRWIGRSTAAVVRTLTLVFPTEVTSLPLEGLTLRAALLTIALTALIAGKPLSDYLANGVPAWLALLLIPQCLPIVLPFTLFWAVLWSNRQRRLPLGLLAVVASGLVLVTTLAAPVANHRFRVGTWSLLVTRNGGHLPSALEDGPPKGLSEMNVRKLVSASIDSRPYSPYTERRATEQLVQRTGFIALAGGLVWLAGVSRFASGRRRWLYGCLPVAALPPLLFVFSSAACWALAALAVVMAARRVYRAATFASADPTRSLV